MNELQLIQDFRFLTVVAGLLGGIVLFFFIRPKNTGDAIVRVTVAILATNMLTDLVAHRLPGIDTNNDLWGVAFLIGFVSYPVLSAVALFFQKRRDRDIVEIIRDTRE